MKKIMAAMFMVLVMIFNISTVAYALNVTVTVPTELEDHQFKAYQIFKGTQGESGGPLANIEWGSGINSDAFVTALKSDAVIGANFASCNSADDIAKVLNTAGSESEVINAVAKIAYKNTVESDGIALTNGINNFEAGQGYYLIVDVTNVTQHDIAANAALLQVTDSIEINVKTDKPSVEKKVLENTKYTKDEGYGNGFNDVADYSMGEDVTFRLIGAVPDMSYYTTYKYIFHDTIAEGFDMPQVGDIRVYLSDDKKLSNEVNITDRFSTQINVDERKIDISCNDIKEIDGIAKGKYIIVEYKAVLGQNAVVGLDGNINEVYLEYSNNPDKSGEGDNETGKTPEDVVIVFTYSLDVNKVDGANAEKKLANAVFQLKASNGKYARVENNKVIGWTDNSNDPTTELKTSANGVVKIIGLDQGTYALTEVKAPLGYNLPSEPFSMEIVADTKNGQNWTGVPNEALTDISATVGGVNGAATDTGKGTVSVTIANNSGTQLPETGGIGTVVLYVAGGVLIIGGILLVIFKKRSRA